MADPATQSRAALLIQIMTGKESGLGGGTPAAFRTILDLFPVTGPLLAPSEGKLALRTQLAGQLGFFPHFHDVDPPG